MRDRDPQTGPPVPDLPALAAAERWRSDPGRGPCIVFFSGGSALRELSRCLKRYTHNSVHFVTPFDSGGSSAALRRAFDMPSVGDLRNRLLALADESRPGAEAVRRLLSERLDPEPGAATRRFEELARGRDEVLDSIPKAARERILDLLAGFARRAGTFCHAGASIGNLVLAGAFFEADRDLLAASRAFADLVNALGTVRPVVTESLHLQAVLEDGSRVVGQHRLTGKEVAPIGSAIRELRLVRSLDGDEAPRPVIDCETRDLIRAADLLCFPMGSFWTSVVANLLPAGVGRAIVEARGPKIYVPNPAPDPEQLGMSLASCVRTLRDVVGRDAGTDPGPVLDAVLVDEGAKGDEDRIEGVPVVAAALGTETTRPYPDPDRLARLLVAWAAR